MKKVILTVTNDLTYDQRMIRICTSLANAGYEVVLVGRKRKHSKPIVQQVFEQKRLTCWWDSGKLFYLEYNIRLFFFLLFAKKDAICAIDLDTILPAHYVCKWSSTKLVYDAHEYFTEVPEVVNRPKVKAVWEWVANKTIAKVDAAYTVGPMLAAIFEQRYGLSFGVVRNVPFARPNTQSQPQDSTNILLYQGVLNDGRGLEELIAAMAYIEHAEFWIAGEGDLSKELRALVAEKQLGAKVKFLGYILPSELKAVTTQATIGINLLQNKGLNYYYSLANKAFDYIQSEKPSLNMAFPEYVAINEKFGCFELVDNLEVDTLVEVINRLTNHPSHYAQLKANCAKAKSIFIWENEEKELINIWNKLLPITKT